MGEKKIEFEYMFKFPDGKDLTMPVRIDSKKLVIDDPGETPEEYKFFTDLEYKQCENCPYNKSTTPECPVAKNIVSVVSNFKDHFSYQEMEIEVHVEQRVYVNKGDVQRGLQSFLGLVMGASNCSHFGLFRPMARFHLPFSDTEETMVRVIGFYLLQEYFKDPKTPIGLDNLKNKYEELTQVNDGMCSRIRGLENHDAGANAIVILSNFVNFFSIYYEDNLDAIKPLFVQDENEDDKEVS